MQDVSFLPATVSAPIEVIEGDNGDIVLIGTTEVPVVDTMFEIQLIQPGHIKENKALKGKAGHWWIGITPEKKKGEPVSVDEFTENTIAFAETVRLLPIAPISRGRTLFPPYDSGDRTLMCYSRDGMVPSTKVISPFAAKCAQITDKGRYEPLCTKAIWVDGQKPECSDQITMAFYDLDRKIPVLMKLSGTGISAWNKFLKALKKQRNIARIKGKRVEDFILVVSSDTKGTYELPVFTYVEATEDNPRDYIPLLKWYETTLLTKYAGKEEEIVETVSDATADAAPDTAEDHTKKVEDAAVSQGFSMES